MVLRPEAKVAKSYDFIPTSDRIFVERVESQSKSDSGLLYLPETAQERANEGVIRAVGPGRRTPEGKLVPMNRAVGERVLFGKYTGTEITIGETTYVLMHEDDVVCVLKERSE